MRKNVSETRDPINYDRLPEVDAPDLGLRILRDVPADGAALMRYAHYVLHLVVSALIASPVFVLAASILGPGYVAFAACFVAIGVLAFAELRAPAFDTWSGVRRVPLFLVGIAAAYLYVYAGTGFALFVGFTAPTTFLACTLAQAVARHVRAWLAAEKDGEAQPRRFPRATRTCVACYLGALAVAALCTLQGTGDYSGTLAQLALAGSTSAAAVVAVARTWSRLPATREALASWFTHEPYGLGEFYSPAGDLRARGELTLGATAGVTLAAVYTSAYFPAGFLALGRALPPGRVLWTWEAAKGAAALSAPDLGALALGGALSIAVPALFLFSVVALHLVEATTDLGGA